VVVACTPRQGRRHQIRAHLLLLGAPIANDVMYGGTADGGAPDPGLAGDAAGEAAVGKAAAGRAAAGGAAAGEPAAATATAAAPLLAYVDDADGTLAQAFSAASREWCIPCRWAREAIAGRQPRPRVQQCIWLHALRYRVPSLGIDVEAPWPAWAREVLDA
jgi:hypothetical protein